MHTVKVAIATTAFSLWAFSAGAVTVTPADAMGQVGHTAKVCGTVASAVYEANSPAHPTFLTLISPDQLNVNRALTGVIYGSDRAKFGSTPESGVARKAYMRDRVRQLLPPKAGDDTERFHAGELHCPAQRSAIAMRDSN